MSNFLFGLLFAQFRTIDHSAVQLTVEGRKAAIGMFSKMSHGNFQLEPSWSETEETEHSTK